jgi:hypothetical protein
VLILGGVSALGDFVVEGGTLALLIAAAGAATLLGFNLMLRRKHQV